MTMKIEVFKEAMDQVKPDMHMETRLLSKVRKPKDEKRFLKVVVSMGLVLALTVGGFYGLPQLTGGVVQHKAAGDEGILMTIQNQFVLSAYADEKDVKDGQNAKTTISEAKITLPFGQIKRGKYVEYRIPFGDKKGQLYQGYEAEYNDKLCFDFQGEHIKSIQMDSETGKFNFMNYSKRRELEQNRELYIAKLILDMKLFDEKRDLFDQFKELWSEGKLERYKEQFFSGKSTNLEDYQISISRPHSYDQSGNEIPSTERVFDKVTQVPVNSAVITLAEKESDMRWMQLYKKSILIPYSECKDYFSIGWIPEKAMEKVSGLGALNYKELPKDTIWITVTYENGEVQNKKVELCFNSEGQVVAQME